MHGSGNLGGSGKMSGFANLLIDNDMFDKAFELGASQD
jgi:hypothetical protein